MSSAVAVTVVSASEVVLVLVVVLDVVLVIVLDVVVVLVIVLVLELDDVEELVVLDSVGEYVKVTTCDAVFPSPPHVALTLNVPLVHAGFPPGYDV